MNARLMTTVEMDSHREAPMTAQAREGTGRADRGLDQFKQIPGATRVCASAAGRSAPLEVALTGNQSNSGQILTWRDDHFARFRIVVETQSRKPHSIGLFGENQTGGLAVLIGGAKLAPKRISTFQRSAVNCRIRDRRSVGPVQLHYDSARRVLLAEDQVKPG